MAEAFDELYAENQDPWDLAGSWYEQRKRQVTVASLPKERYSRCYEPGCSIGELTKLLAPRCDGLLAVDSAEDAVRHAQEATRAFGHVRVEQAVLPKELPEQTFDLVVISELLYYLEQQDLLAFLDGVVGRLASGGELVAVHMQARDGCEGGNHWLLAARPELDVVIHHEDERFVLDIFRKQ